MLTGSVRLSRQLRQKHLRHHDHLPALSVHLRRGRSPVVRGNVLHVQRLVEGNTRHLQVGLVISLQVQSLILL